MSGCLTGDAGLVARFAMDQPHGFSALVQDVNGRYSGYVNLSGPVQVTDHDGRQTQAYLYEQAMLFRGEYQRLYHYLDGDLREIARVLGCGYTFLSCDQYLDWSWADRGAIGPAGLGHPDKIVADDFVMKRGGHEEPIEWTASIDDQDRLVLTMNLSAPAQGAQVYRYTEGRALPDGPTFTVQEYQDLGPLPPIESLALPTGAPDARPWLGLMFPGEDLDPFAVGATHAEIAAFALAALDDPDAACIEAYRIEPTRHGEKDELEAPDPPYGQDLMATSEVRVVHGDTRTTFDITVYHNRLDGDTDMVRTSGTNGAAPFTCTEMQRSPWPSASFDEARAKAAALLGHDDLWTFEHELGYKARNQNQPAPHGWHTYRFSFQPDWAGEGATGFWDPYTMSLDTAGPMLTVHSLAPPEATFRR